MRLGLLVVGLVVALGACQSTPPRRPPLPPVASARPPSPPPPLAFSSSDIDRMIRAEWVKAKVTPAPPADDARWLRRVYVDVVGTLPPPDVVTAFLADASADKRARMVDRLLDSAAYAEHWTNYWDDLLMGQTLGQDLDRAAFRAWLHDRFAGNEPWNKLVYELLTARGQNSVGGPRNVAAMAAVASSATMGSGENAPDRSDAGTEGEINGAVNWLLKFQANPEDMAGSTSRTFLGVQIQCAQCHDHKTEKWKQTDFRSFAACFARTRAQPIDKGKVTGIRRVEVEDIGRPLPRYVGNPELAPVALSPPKTLDGADLSKAPNARAALAEWITAPNNPWFAKATVNRMWGHFLGRGFVDPVDDLRPSNPATMPELLDKISDDFTAHGYDLKRLVRLIALSEVYQLSAQKPAGVSPDSLREGDRSWARFRLAPLGPEELLNAILEATDVEGTLRRSGRPNLLAIRAQLFRQYSFLFDVDEEFEQTDFEGTVSQALALLNGSLVGGGTNSLPGGALGQILAAHGDDADKVRALYLRTLSRPPSQAELDDWTRYVADARNAPADSPPAAASATPGAPAPPLLPPPSAKGKPGKGKNNPGGPGRIPALEALEARDAERVVDPRRLAYEDLFWTLLNSSEFIFNH